MLTKRIIPCLDIKNGRVVKGINFKNLTDAGDPVECAKKYEKQGADELVFLDISASEEKRKTLTMLVEKISKEISIPFTVGGGIKTVKDISSLLNAGADKVSLNSAAIQNPELIANASRRFGSQCIAVAIDAKKDPSARQSLARDDREWKVYITSGKQKTELNAVEWAKEAVEKGAGELLVTSIDRDGTKQGFDNELLSKISLNVTVQVIASGGAGSKEDILKAFTKGKADAVLAASIFHFNEISISDLKKYLAQNNIKVRI